MVSSSTPCVVALLNLVPAGLDPFRDKCRQEDLQHPTQGNAVLPSRSIQMPDTYSPLQSAKRDTAQNEFVHGHLTRRWVSLILGILQGLSRRVRCEFTAELSQETGLSLGEPPERLAV